MPDLPSIWLRTINPGGFIDPHSRFAFAQGPLNYIVRNVVPFGITLVFYVIFSLALIFLLVGGIKWITSTGEKEAMAKAKGTITYALVGLAVAVGSFIILNIVQKFFGSSLLVHP